MARSGKTSQPPRPPRRSEHASVNTTAGRIQIRVDEVTADGRFIGPVTHLWPSIPNAMDVHGIVWKDVLVIPGLEYIEVVVAGD